MRVFQRLIGVITTIALATTFVALGALACLTPPVTHVLSNAYASDDLSPFDRSQLVKVADATRDFSFGSHNELALYQVIYQIDKEYQQSLSAKGGNVGFNFPKIGQVTDTNSITQMREAFDGASEMYCFSPDTISHLNDCHNIANVAFPALAIVALVAIVGLALTALIGKRRWLGGVLVATGLVVIIVFGALGVWAVADFSSLFAAFHQLFFNQGNWTFPYDSLLICALPTEFWMGMVAIWLAVAGVVSILSVVIGIKLRKRHVTRKD